MRAPTANQLYHLILADIAMAGAIKACGGSVTLSEADYEPGSLRDRWLANATDAGLRARVTAMASAGVGSLSGMEGERVLAAAESYGVPLKATVAEAIAEHFANKREALLTYNR